MAVVYGISDKYTVMVDLDNMGFRKAVSLAKLTMNHFKLGGFVILKSSDKNYHVVFDKPVRSWNEVLRIISWTGIMANNPHVWKWACMQAVKKSCTLRISEKPSKDGVKPKPKVVYRFGSQNQQIKAFLLTRKEVLTYLKKIGKASVPLSVPPSVCPFVCFVSVGMG